MNRFASFAVVLSLSATAFAGFRAVTPASDDGGWRKDWWMPRHEQKLAEIAAWTNEVASADGEKEIPVVFLGDSITHYWETRGAAVWAEYFAHGAHRAIDLGFSGDRTEHVLWRIAHGEFDGYRAGTVVLMIGTNNTGHFPREQETPAETIAGVRAVLDALRAKQPTAKIVLCSVFPCDTSADGQRRVRNFAVNEGIRRFCDGVWIHWCPIYDQFLEADGTLTAEIMPDALHPGETGYRIWAKAVIPAIDRARAVRAESPCEIALDRLNERWWTDRLASKLGDIRTFGTNAVDVVFAGDSITHGWEGNEGKDEYAALRDEFGVLNIGYSGDRIEHALWHAANGELEGYRAKAVMLMIGTNNCGETPEAKAAGVKNLLAAIRAKQPQAKIVLLPIFPRGKDATDAQRVKNLKANELIRPLADGKDVIWCDFTAKMLEADGTPRKDVFCGDNLHLVKGGYALWREAVAPIFRELCK